MAVERVDGSLQRLCEVLTLSLENSEAGAGLAANQIGGQLRAVAIKEWNSKRVKVLVNPEVVKTFGEKAFIKMANKSVKSDDFLEGCLSVPGFFGTVRRFLKIGVAWQEVEGGRLIDKEAEYEGFEAVVLQHEIDHLDGVLFIDRVKKDGGKFYKQVGEEMVEWKIEEILEEEKVSFGRKSDR